MLINLNIYYINIHLPIIIVYIKVPSHLRLNFKYITSIWCTKIKSVVWYLI